MGTCQASEKLRWSRDGPERRKQRALLVGGAAGAKARGLKGQGVLGHGDHGVQGATFRTPILPATRPEACAPLSLRVSGRKGLPCRVAGGEAQVGQGSRHCHPGGDKALDAWLLRPQEARCGAPPRLPGLRLGFPSCGGCTAVSLVGSPLPPGTPSP